MFNTNVEGIHGSWYLFSGSESPGLVISSHPTGDSVPTPSGRVPGFRMLEPGDASPLRCSPRLRFRRR